MLICDDSLTINCHTGEAHALDAANNIIVPNYVPTDSAPAGFTNWEGPAGSEDDNLADGAAGAQRTPEYNNDGGGAESNWCRLCLCKGL